MSYLKSDEEGFFFHFPDFSGSKTIQFVDYQHNDIKVKILSDIELEETGTLVYTPRFYPFKASRQRKNLTSRTTTLNTH